MRARGRLWPRGWSCRRRRQARRPRAPECESLSGEREPARPSPDQAARRRPSAQTSAPRRVRASAAGSPPPKTEKTEASAEPTVQAVAYPPMAVHTAMPGPPGRNYRARVMRRNPKEPAGDLHAAVARCMAVVADRCKRAELSSPSPTDSRNHRVPCDRAPLPDSVPEAARRARRDVPTRSPAAAQRGRQAAALHILARQNREWAHGRGSPCRTLPRDVPRSRRPATSLQQVPLLEEELGAQEDRCVAYRFRRTERDRRWNRLRFPPKLPDRCSGHLRLAMRAPGWRAFLLADPLHARLYGLNRLSADQAAVCDSRARDRFRARQTPRPGDSLAGDAGIHWMNRHGQRSIPPPGLRDAVPEPLWQERRGLEPAAARVALEA